MVSKLEATFQQWLRSARATNLPVSSSILIEKTDNLALQMEYDNFKCRYWWFEHFKKRNAVSSKSIHYRSGALDMPK